MRIGLISSQQPGNLYTGIATNEMEQMRKVATQLFNRWTARGIDVTLGPGYDYNKDGKRTYLDNVTWEKAQNPFDLLISFHSNAAGDSCVLWGTSATSEKYGRKIMDVLNADNPFPGDIWTYNSRKVAEVAGTNSPAVLIELSRHDWAKTAAELVRRIADGTLVVHLDRVLSRALNLPAPIQPTQEEIMSDLTPATIRQAFVDAEPDFDWAGRNARDAAEKATVILGKLDALTATVSERAGGSGPGAPDAGISGPGAPDPDPSAPAPVTVDLVAIFREVVRQAAYDGVLQALTDYEAAREVPTA